MAKNVAAGGVGPPLHAFVANNLADATATSRALLTDAVRAAARPQVRGGKKQTLLRCKHSIYWPVAGALKLAVARSQNPQIPNYGGT